MRIYQRCFKSRKVATEGVVDDFTWTKTRFGNIKASTPVLKSDNYYRLQTGLSRDFEAIYELEMKQSHHVSLNP